MDDGPTDFESGYFFESQKRIQDRRNALGLDQRSPRSSTSSESSSYRSADNEGGQSFVASVILTAIYYAGVALFWFVVGAAWITWQVIVGIFSRRR